jgi:chromosome segregation ATPase
MRSKAVEELKSQLRSIKDKITILDATLENGIEKIKERCSLLKHQILTLMKAESLIDEINKMRNEMQKKIDKYEIECVESFEKNKEIKERIKAKLNEGSLFYETSSKYVSQIVIDDDKFETMRKNAIDTYIDLKKSKIELKRLMFTNKYTEFKENDMKLDKTVLGWIEEKNSHLDSLILNDTQKADLFELCELEISNITPS